MSTACAGRAPRPIDTALRAAMAAVAIASSLPASAASPRLEVREAVVRAPRPGFSGGLVSMQITASQAARIVGASSTVAQAVEFKRLVRQGSELRVESVDHIPLSAATPAPLQLGEGRFHLMLSHPKRPLVPGQSVVMRLQLGNAAGDQRWTVPVRMRVVGPTIQRNAEDDHMH